MTTSKIHNQEYEFYSWESLGEDIFNLAQQILESGQKFDRIIALAKGGLTFARSLVDYLAVADLSTMQIQFYTGIGETQRKPVVVQDLPVPIKGEKILVFDDIVDSGETLKLAIEYLTSQGAASIVTATLLQKPWANPKDNWHARESSAWVIFPNEIRETITTLVDLWGKKGDTPAEIKQNLLSLGFSKAQVDLFAGLA